jgi:hypothetical protein
METPLSELCKGLPSCFKEYMEHAKKLEFTQEPDYKFMIGVFDACMSENSFDPKLFDYTWKEDRLIRDKKLLKEEMMKALKGPAKKKGPEESKA